MSVKCNGIKRDRAKPVIAPRFLHRSEIDRDFKDFFEEESGNMGEDNFFLDKSIRQNRLRNGFIACESYK